MHKSESKNKIIMIITGVCLSKNDIATAQQHSCNKHNYHAAEFCIGMHIFINIYFLLLLTLFSIISSPLTQLNIQQIKNVSTYIQCKYVQCMCKIAKVYMYRFFIVTHKNLLTLTFMHLAFAKHFHCAKGSLQ